MILVVVREMKISNSWSIPINSVLLHVLQFSCVIALKHTLAFFF